MLYKKNQAEKLEDSLFEQPTAEYRELPLGVEYDAGAKELDRQMEVLKSMGFGVHICIRVPVWKHRI
ncbi:MAG: hypothetical protein ACLU3U_04690 [Gallintestinimicrobium sp.]